MSFKFELIRWLDEQASHYRRLSRMARRKRTMQDVLIRAEIYEHLKTMIEQDRLPFQGGKDEESRS